MTIDRRKGAHARTHARTHAHTHAGSGKAARPLQCLHPLGTRTGVCVECVAVHVETDDERKGQAVPSDGKAQETNGFTDECGAEHAGCLYRRHCAD